MKINPYVKLWPVIKCFFFFTSGWTWWVWTSRCSRHSRYSWQPRVPRFSRSTGAPRGPRDSRQRGNSIFSKMIQLGLSLASVDVWSLVQGERGKRGKNGSPGPPGPQGAPGPLVRRHMTSCWLHFLIMFCLKTFFHQLQGAPGAPGVKGEKVNIYFWF